MTHSDFLFICLQFLKYISYTKLVTPMFSHSNYYFFSHPSTPNFHFFTCIFNSLNVFLSFHSYFICVFQLLLESIFENILFSLPEKYFFIFLILDHNTRFSCIVLPIIYSVKLAYQLFFYQLFVKFS